MSFGNFDNFTFDKEDAGKHLFVESDSLKGSTKIKAFEEFSDALSRITQQQGYGNALLIHYSLQGKQHQIDFISGQWDVDDWVSTNRFFNVSWMIKD